MGPQPDDWGVQYKLLLRFQRTALELSGRLETVGDEPGNPYVAVEEKLGVVGNSPRVESKRNATMGPPTPAI